MISPWNHDQFWKTKTVTESTFPEDFGTPPRCSIWMIIQWDIQGLVTTKFSFQISVKDEAPVSSIWLHMKIQRSLSLLWWPLYNLILPDSPSFASYWFGKHFSLVPLDLDFTVCTEIGFTTSHGIFYWIFWNNKNFSK